MGLWHPFHRDLGVAEAAWLVLPWSVLRRLALLIFLGQAGTDYLPVFCCPEQFPVVWGHEEQGSS